MNAFVTGSTGLLGGNLVKLLLDRGHTVTALVRSPEKARKVLGDSPRLRLVTGDMEDVAGFAPHLQGCDVLFHTAAYFREYFAAGDHWPKLERINIQGTLQLLDAAEGAGMQKAIYVSSSGVIGRRTDGHLADESTPPDETVLQNLYFKSKVLAEEAIAAWLKTHKLPVVLILPTWMYGPQDAAPTTAGRLVLDFLQSKLPAVVPGGNPVVDVRDVAQAMINAVDRGRNGERYIINHEFRTLANIVQTLEKVSGVPAPRVHLPYPLALTIAWVSETVAKVCGQEALMTVNGIRSLKHGVDVSAAKARRELGLTFHTFEETLRDSVTWYRANGLV